jgi:hypothetical protein
MVNFPDQIITQLVVVDNAGNRVVIIGPGPSIVVHGQFGSIVLDGTAALPIQFFYNIDASHYSFINLGNSDAAHADIGVNGSDYPSPRYPSKTLRSRLWLLPPTVGSQLAYYDVTNNGLLIGGGLSWKDDGITVALRNITGAPYAQMTIQNTVPPLSPDSGQIAMQAGTTGLNGPILFLTPTFILLQNAANTRSLVQDTDGFWKVFNQGWNTLAYLNAWATRAGFFDLAYKVMPDGMVNLRGTCVPGAVNGVVATLPAAVRPASNVSFPAAHDNVVAGQMARITVVATTGNITAFGMAAVGTTFSFDQCKWPLV